MTQRKESARSLTGPRPPASHLGRAVPEAGSGPARERLLRRNAWSLARRTCYAPGGAAPGMVDQCDGSKLLARSRFADVADATASRSAAPARSSCAAFRGSSGSGACS